MVEATDTDHAPWYRVQADDKRRARLNGLGHLLSMIPYEEMDWQLPEVGKRKKKKTDTHEDVNFEHEVPPPVPWRPHGCTRLRITRAVRLPSLRGPPPSGFVHRVQ